MYTWTKARKPWLQRKLPVQVGVLLTQGAAGDSSSVIAKSGARCRTEFASPGRGADSPPSAARLALAPRCPADTCQLSNLRGDRRPNEAWRKLRRTPWENPLIRLDRTPSCNLKAEVGLVAFPKTTAPALSIMEHFPQHSETIKSWSAKTCRCLHWLTWSSWTTGNMMCCDWCWQNVLGKDTQKRRLKYSPRLWFRVTVIKTAITCDGGNDLFTSFSFGSVCLFFVLFCIFRNVLLPAN